MEKNKVEIIEDEFWDYYSGLPNPMWYQQIEKEEENTSDSSDNTVTTK